MGVRLSHNCTSFLIFRLAIGAIGASFVITSYHTSVMFAPNVGTANATAAGWGNPAGGVTQFTMPLLFSASMSLGTGSRWSWRLATGLAGVALCLTGIAYYFLTQDTPDGDIQKLRAEGAIDHASRGAEWLRVPPPPFRSRRFLWDETSYRFRRRGDHGGREVLSVSTMTR